MALLEKITGSASVPEEYENALKTGRRYYQQMTRKGSFPYPSVLEDMLAESDIAGRQDMGLVNIPTEFIVGTESAGRTAALAGNFMPLLDEKTEFAIKWQALCRAHLNEGIRDAIKCIEYLGKFYVIEGNKRVSVLKHFGSPTIPANVTRIIPKYSDDNAVVVYYEFIKFYNLTKLYTVDFNNKGDYPALIRALGMSDDHVWSEDERRSFNSGFETFAFAYKPLREDYPDITTADAFLAWLKINDLKDIKELSIRAITQQISALIPDILAARHEDKNILSMDPSISERGFVRKLFVPTISHLNVDFFLLKGTEGSAWTMGHESGRNYIDVLFGSLVTVTTHRVTREDCLEEMENAVKDGADIIFATVPAMIDVARYLSKSYPDVKFLVCAPSMPYTGVRMYYTRTYECKFIAGAIAAIMSDNDLISYTAHYPIFGTPANINAFALGASMVRPKCKVDLHWTCIENDHPNPNLIDGNSYARLRWNWGYFYEKIIRSVLDGSWDDYDKDSSVNYWWGLNSDAADILLSTDLPTSVKTLADNLKYNIINKTLDPFHMTIYDQNGVLRNDGKNRLTAQERLDIDWLCSNVIGSIPEIDDVIPNAKETVQLLGIHRNDDIYILKKEAQL